MSDSPDHTLMLRSALWYAHQGISVFPVHYPARGRDGQLWCDCGKHDCSSKAKHPLTPHGLDDATIDQRQIEAWWSRCPYANIGIALSETDLVLDVDPRGGGDVALQSLCEQHGKLPVTQHVLTGGGGEHYKMTKPAALKINNTSGVLGPGLDIKTKGGYVIAPPSLHITGNRYNWESGAHIKDTPAADAPDWLLNLLEQKSTRANGAGFRATNHDIHEGEGRNTYLYTFGRALRNKGLSEKVLRVALQAENEERCKPRIDSDEFEKILHNLLTQADRPDSHTRKRGSRWYGPN